MSTFGIGIRNGNSVVARNGNMTTFPIQTTTETPIVNTNIGGQSPVGQVTIPTTISARSNQPSPMELSPYRTIVRPQQNIDILNLTEYTITNGSLQEVLNLGISTLRPELIGLVDYKPFFINNSETETQKISAISYESNILKKDIVNGMLTELLSSSKEEVESWNNEKQLTYEQVQRNLNFFILGFNNLEAIKNSFDIKNIQESFFDTRNFESPRNFFRNTLLFSNNSFDSFSNTKILYQLSYDLRKTLETYSLKLLGSSIPQRLTDTNSININKALPISQESFYSQGLANSQFPYRESGMRALLSSLPSSDENKIKFIINFLSKELRISSGFDRQTENYLTQNFGTNSTVNSNPFDNIIGDVGNDIFETPFGTNSLSSLFEILVPNVSNIKVLPFEKKEIDQSQNIFLPGPRYFVDSILDFSTNNFNTQPLLEFANRYNNVFSNVNFLITQKFFSLNSEQTQEKVFLNFFEKIRNSFSTIDLFSENGLQLLSIALFKIANRDTNFKLMLFQYLLLLGLTTLNATNEKVIFKNFATELRELRGLNFVNVGIGENPDLNSGNSLTPYLNRLAEAIEDYIFNSLPSATNSNLNNINGFGLQRGAIAHLLSTAGSTRIQNIFKGFINFSESIYVGNITRDTFTKFNNVSTSLFLGLCFECFSSFISRYFDATITNSNNLNSVVVVRNKLYNSSVIRAIDEFFTTTRATEISYTIDEYSQFLFDDVVSRNETNSAGLYSTSTFRNNFLDIKNKLIDEDRILLNFLHIFERIGSNLRNTSTNLINYFSSLANIDRTIFLNSINLYKDNFKKGQLRNSIYLFENYKKFFENGSDIKGFNVTTYDWNLLNSLLKTDKYNTDSNFLKLFMVGIPNSFSDKLSEKIEENEITNQNSLEQAKNKTLVYVKIYRKSIENSNIIFKPKKYIFDLATYNKILDNEIEIDKNSNFFGTNGNIAFCNFLDLIDVNNSTINFNIRTINNISRFNVLTNEQKQNLITNHALSYLFEKYLQLLANFKITEETFPLQPYINDFSNPNSFATRSLTNLIQNYLTIVGKLNLEEATKVINSCLTKTNNRNIFDDDARLLLTDSNLLHNGELCKQKILIGKKFERTFIIPVNLNEFAIDIDETNKTENGKKALDVVGNRIILNTLTGESFISKDETINLDDYFITIETVF